MATLSAALAGLRDELAAAGKLNQFEVLKPFLDAAGEASYAEAAATLKMTETAVRVAVHRLREKYRRHLRQAAAETVESPDEIDAELRALLAAVGS